MISTASSNDSNGRRYMIGTKSLLLKQGSMWRKPLNQYGFGKVSLHLWKTSSFSKNTATLGREFPSPIFGYIAPVRLLYEEGHNVALGFKRTANFDALVGLYEPGLEVLINGGMYREVFWRWCIVVLWFQRQQKEQTAMPGPKSASGITMMALLPPNSKMERPNREATADPMDRPHIGRSRE